MSILLDGTGGVTTPGVVNTAGETIATTLSVTGATNLAVSSGNVGIGTASPSAKLNVVTSGGNSRISIGDTAVATYSTVLMYGGNGKYNWQLGAQANVNNAFEITPSTAAGGTTFSTPAFIVDSSGNVGIGTTAPAAPLNVTKYVLSGGQNYSGRFSDAINSTYSIAHQAGLTNLITDTAMAFYTSNTERMRIDSSGNLMVGAASVGLLNNNSFICNVSGGNFIQNHVSGTGSGANYTIFVYSANNIGSITQSGTTAVAYNTTSDYRLKENIKPLSGALARVAALKPCTYTWKSAPDEVGEGFIAHELAEVCSQATTGEKDAVNEDGTIKPQGIDTSFLVATLTAAIQEQQALIIQLQADVATLKALSA